MSKGWVYVLTNEHMPGLVKIGRTTRSVSERALEIYQTGVPAPFKVAFSVRSPDCVDLEDKVHAAAGKYRVSGNREFFRLPAHVAIEILDTCHHEQVDSWLSEFRPGTQAAWVETVCDIHAISGLAGAYLECEISIVDAINDLTAEEILPALLRVRERRLHGSEEVPE